MQELLLGLFIGFSPMLFWLFKLKNKNTELEIKLKEQEKTFNAAQRSQTQMNEAFKSIGEKPINKPNNSSCIKSTSVFLVDNQ
jgi:hypothetical protein